MDPSILNDGLLHSVILKVTVRALDIGHPITSLRSSHPFPFFFFVLDFCTYGGKVLSD